MSEYSVPLEEAVERLVVIDDYDPGTGPQPCVHTFRLSAVGLLGAHWTVADAQAAMEKHGVEEAGAEASAMGHRLVFIDDTGPVFLEAREASDD